ncbi:transcription factor S [Candidatus Geothermarchaeota archaeon]|nr:MAG: transcription factor S [Candidatus Geothermarchaeota archaeon]HEW93895.1 transcription factor S [Thermoprotei archaeon]
MKFCPRCKSLMRIEKKEEKIFYICPSCGYVEEITNPRITMKIQKKERVTVIEKDHTVEAIVKVKCPKCNNDTAYTWIVQTRSGDEASTVFYKCTKCGYTWRVYP